MATPPTINDYFQQLDKWRHFPAFPLEARSEVFFALFLPIVFEKCEGVSKINPLIIPQFPLKKDNNQSVKVDFFALSQDSQKGYLVELKTDMRSRRGEQDKYLNDAIDKGMSAILRGYKEILKSSADDKYTRQKYFHMTHALAELDLIKLRGNLEDTIYPGCSGGVDRPKVKKLIDKICIPKPPCVLKVVYVQPYKRGDYKPDKHHYIYFDEFADIVESQGDMGGLFAGYLRKWANDPATSPPPKTTGNKA